MGHAATRVDGLNVYAARMIMRAHRRQFVDHIDRDPLNNERSNLRFCTKQQNQRNQGMRKCNSSGYKGVARVKHSPRWRAFLKVSYKQIHLGMFDTKEEAALAYNRAALKYYGEFACLNVIGVV
jgi:hypothetical protein